MKKSVSLPAVLLMSLTLLFCTAALAENWPQWRGPNFDGSSNATGLPEKFSADENVVWKAAMPGPSSGTPIVWENRIFVSSIDAKSKKLLAICIDRESGREAWRKEVGIGFKENPSNNQASPSPLTDGKHVWFHYATGDVVCFDMEGKEVWARNIVKDHGPLNFMWIYGSSPLLHNGKLYLQVIHRDTGYDGGQQEGPADSYLLTLEPETGKELWKKVRKDEAVEESKESYATPIPFLSSDKGEIVLVGGDVVTGHDPETGEELWRAGNWNPDKINHWRMVPSVVTGGGLVFACAPKNGPVMAIKSGGDIAWESREFTSDVCVPLYYDDKLYVLDGDGRKITCVNPQDGKPLWTSELGGDHVFRASPTGADGKIYCVNEGAQVWVVSMEDGKILNQTDLGGDASTRASIALADRQIFIRTADTLYCFGKK